MEKKINNYCRKCGNQLVKSVVNADKIEKHMCDGSGGTWCRLASSFDPATGEKNTATIYQCSQYRRKWYGKNNHDIFCVYDGYTKWGIRIKSLTPTSNIEI